MQKYRKTKLFATKRFVSARKFRTFHGKIWNPISPNKKWLVFQIHGCLNHFSRCTNCGRLAPKGLKTSVSPFQTDGSSQFNQSRILWSKWTSGDFSLISMITTFHIASPQRPKKNGGVMCAHVGHFLGESSFSQIR